MIRLAALGCCLMALGGCAAVVELGDVQGPPDASFQRVTRADYLAHRLGLEPEFEQILPFMGFDLAAQAGYGGTGVRVLIIDFFGQHPYWGAEHGWAVLETLMAVAPQAEYWRLDLADVFAEIKRDQREPFDPVLRALQKALVFFGLRKQGVINMSFGYIQSDTSCSTGTKYDRGIATAIRSLWKRNVNLVASAGNGGGFNPSFPACIPQVLAVGSIYDQDQELAQWPPDPDSGFAGCKDEPVVKGAITCFSNRGEIYAVGAFAEGYRQYRGQQPFAGTSLAAPLVTGALALLRGAGLHAAEAQDELLGSASLAWHGNRLYRILDVGAALGVKKPPTANR